MLLNPPIFAQSSPIILIINRQGKCRVIQFNSPTGDKRVTTTLASLFLPDQGIIIQEASQEVLDQQVCKPLAISRFVSGVKISYFGYLFPLSLGSVLFLAQPLNAFVGESQQQAINFFPLPSFIYNAKTFQITAVNQVAIDQYGYSQQDFLDKKLSELYPSQNIPTPLKQVSQLVTGEWHNYRSDGKLMNLAMTAYPLNLEREKLILLTAQNITEYKYTQTALQEKNDSELISSFPPCGILIFNQQWRYTLAVGEAIDQLIQLTMTEGNIEGNIFSESFSPQLRNLLEPLQKEVFLGKYLSQRFQYAQYTYYLQSYPLSNENGVIVSGILIIQNLTANKKLEALLDKHAFSDPNTYLPNKTWFLEQISHHLQTNCEQGLAIILIKLERYAVIKYGLGFEMANQLIIAVAKRLKETLQLNYDFARVGDANLAVILPNLDQKEEIEKVTQLIHYQLSLPLNIAGQELFCPVSIGVSIYDGFLKEPSALLHAADTAMNAARGEVKFPCVVFHPYLHHSAATRVQLETELRRALRLKQLYVFYQPTVNITNGKLVGFEALVRWQHPEKGLVSPSKFMPLAKELGLIGLIDWWVLAEACEKLAIWQKMIPEGESLSMNVNLSENMINQVGILERLENIINDSGITPKSLKLEVTEEIILEETTAILGTLNQLQQMGILLSIDDFGTGYSSLQRLHQLPINTLKIDRCFTKRMLKESEIMQIVKTIISLAHNLKMDVIAEGIEEQEQWEVLKVLGCEYGQGFLFGKALSEAKIRELIASHQGDLIIK
ncbi:MAG: EAL domain-containing protein [Halothece sp.]